jgi:hypothetical protein
MLLQSIEFYINCVYLAGGLFLDLGSAFERGLMMDVVPFDN